jgi:POT family proton-dependent oligopeptide transporter
VVYIRKEISEEMGFSIFHRDKYWFYIGFYGYWFCRYEMGDAGFGLAGIALFGLIVYVWGQKFLGHVGNLDVQEIRWTKVHMDFCLRIFSNLKCNYH